MNNWILTSMILFGSSGHLAPIDDHASIHDELEQMLAVVQARHEAGTLIRARDQWPRDLPMQIKPILVTFDRTDHAYWVEFADCDQNPLFRYMWMHGHIPNPFRSGWHDGTITLPTKCISDDGEVRFAMRIIAADEEGPSSDFKEMSFSVELVESVDDILAPVVDPALMDHLADNVSVIVYRGSSRDNRAVLLMQFPTNLPDDMTIAFDIELFVGNNEHVLGSANIATTRIFRQLQSYHAQRSPASARHPIRLHTDIDFDEFHEQAAGQEVRARFIGNPEIALRELESVRYLDGSFTVDVRVYPPNPEP